LKAEIFLASREDQNHAWCLWKILNRSFETKILEIHFHISRIGIS